MNFVKKANVGGQVTFLGDLDPNFISVSHILKHVKVELKYNNVTRMCVKLGREAFVDAMAILETDADVLRVINKISQSKKKDELYICLEHEVDIPDYVGYGIRVENMESPQIRVAPGSPKKARVQVEGEPQDQYRVTHAGYGIWCGKCGVSDHNALSCKKLDNPNRQIYPKKPGKKNRNPEGTPHDGENGTSQTAGTFGTAGTSQPAGTTTRKRRGTQANVMESAQPRRSPRKKTSAQPNREVEQPNVVTMGSSKPPTLPHRSPRKKASTNPILRATQ
ncbi:hypothetical protein CJ030_MR3G009537 [Morella rubra]|uniref:PB1-like domain-containing protein n=1 Tax=Morella rubra TaxID=262757 RepID=A0A6A1W448_9ROSI|nr:hypothetical protein CJ030_MR3G009537 [Morella rubra]